MKIHSLVVLQKSGVPIYYRNFSKSLEDLDFNLLSSFLVAILQFSDKVVKKDLNVLEIGELRFFIEEKKELIFVLITELTASQLLIKDRIDSITNTFFWAISPKECLNLSSIIENQKLDKDLEEIVGLRDDSTDQTIEPVKKLFEEEINKGDFLAGALLSMQGQIFYSSLKNEDLHSAMKELEIRSHAEVNVESSVMPKLIYQAGEKMFFSQTILSQTLQIPLFIVILFSNDTNIGMADFALEDMVKKIGEII